MKLIIATNNKNKIIEIKSKLSGIGNLELIPLGQLHNSPDVIEDGATFHENAEKKAKTIAHFADCPAMADDSGLVVDALDGRPGVYSARYSGKSATDTDRNKKILEEMKNISGRDRSARFVCIIAISLPDGTCHFAEGTCEGHIAQTMSGNYGFGYDPIFFLPDLGKTMAELSLDEKNRISHRAKALDAARDILIHLCNHN